MLNNNTFKSVCNVISTHPIVKHINRPIDAGIVQSKRPRRNEKIFVRKDPCPSCFHEILSILRATSIRATVKIVVIKQ